MRITRAGSQPSEAGPAEWFTGRVRLDAPIETEAPASLKGATVTFEPGARTNWHTHPRGQTLVVIAGEGRVCREGEPVEAIRPGDIVWFAAGERHWHGAAPDVAMIHIALQEADESGRTVDWEGPVSDAEYRG